MKPLKLELYNIGPFTGKTTIDFEELGEIFLISGKTGSGKTTILDSLAYALYGKIPGARSGLSRNMIRSHFVADTEASSVKLDFILKNRKYRVERIPPTAYLSTKTGVKKDRPEEASLFVNQQTKGISTQWELITTKLSEVNDYILELIGLNSEEFSRIVLLPQGEFAEFLRQNSNERRKSLSRLFPVELYGKITQKALALQSEYRRKIQDVEHMINNLAQEFSIDTWQEDISKIDMYMTENRKRQQDIREKTIQLVTIIESERTIFQRIEEQKKLTQELQEHEEQQTYMDELTKKLKFSDISSTLLPLVHAKKNSQERMNGAQIKLAQCSESIEESESELEHLCQEEHFVIEAQEQCRLMEFSIKELEKSAELEILLQKAQEKYTVSTQKINDIQKNIEKLTEEIDVLENSLCEITIKSTDITKLSEIDTQTSEALTKAKQIRELSDKAHSVKKTITDTETALNSKNKEIEELEKALLIIVQEIERLEEKKHTLNKEEQAANLSEMLEEGKACPVCGSKSHPNPASRPAYTEFSISETLLAKKLVKETLEKKKHEAVISRASFTARLDSAQTSFKDLVSSYYKLTDSQDDIPTIEESSIILAQASSSREQSRRSLDEAHRMLSRQEQAEQKKKALEIRLVPLREELSSIRVTEASIIEEIKQIEKQLKDSLPKGEKDSPSNIIVSLKNSIKEKQAFIVDYRSRKEEIISKRDSLVGRCEELEKNCTLSIKEFEIAEEKLQESIENSPFSCQEDIELSCISNELRLKHEETVNTWLQRKTEIATLLTRLDNELEGKAIPDIEQHEQELVFLQNELEKESSDFTIMSGNKNKLVDKKQRWDILESQRQELSEQGRLYIQLADDLSGNNIKKRSFEAWILGVYLEEIILYASRRLERMSEGRYRLLLDSEKGGRQRYSGLDLEIFDSYTGKKRPCESLSGGETFMASISLALALTDAVQNRAGGIQLDAIFIDEGFGSLDDSTLERALSILDEIRGTRMIGLISHVGELKNRIPVRLEVSKTATGSTVEVCEG